jgi:branched-chain amino acid transport system permease protein
MYGNLRPRDHLPAAVLLGLAFVLPPLAPTYFLYVGNTLMMYAILALGLDILMGWSGQFAFAHIAFYGIGIYATALVQVRFGIPFILGLPIAAVVAGLVGWTIAWPATRLRTVYLALATYAFSECAQWVFRTWDKVTGGGDGLRISPPSVLGYVTGTDARAFPVMAVMLAMVLTGTLYLTRSRFGRHLCTIRDSEHVAAASGIDVRKTKVAAFVISAIFAGIAGSTYTIFQSFVNPDVLGVNQLVLVLTMVVVGGTGSIAGVFVGVVVIGLRPEVLRAAPSSLLVWQEFVYGLILLLSIMFMPRGLWELIEARLRRRPARGRSVTPIVAGTTPIVTQGLTERSS